MMDSTSEAGPSTPRIVASAPTEEIPVGFERWRKSLSEFTGLGLSDDEKARLSEVAASKREEKEFTQCEKWKKALMTDSALT
jgi:inner membrane protease ATP23